MSDRYVTALRFPWLTGLYDPVVRGTTRESEFKRRLVRQASIQPGDRVLDLGCGTGTLAIQVKSAQPDANVVGLDGDSDVLDRARHKTGEAAVEVQFDHGLSTELPYADDTFDTVLTTLFFHHLGKESKRRTVREIARVLRPGGQLHVADWGRPADPLMRALFLQIRLLDGFGQTADNVAGALPAMFEREGLERATETDRMRTVFGTLALYRANTTLT